MTSYEDNTAPYVYGNNIRSNVAALEKISDLLIQWLSGNHTKANEDKCRVLLLIKENLNLNTDPAQVQNSSFKKLLKAEIDCKPSFKGHIGSICKTSLRQTRVSGYMNADKKVYYKCFLFVSFFLLSFSMNVLQ